MTGAELLTAYAAGRRDFSGANLSDATLRDADLRGADLSGADLRYATLRDADLRGADLSGATLRDATLRGADLRDADLRGADLSGADLSDATLRGADLSGANLSGDLRGADLSGATLSRADLSGAIGLPPAPAIPNIDAAILAKIDAGGVLDMARWHTCETTHCRAGWAVHLAGEAGAALEREYSTNVAAALIYAASRPNKRIPNWYATDAEALEDLRACAAEAP